MKTAIAFPFRSSGIRLKMAGFSLITAFLFLTVGLFAQQAGSQRSNRILEASQQRVQRPPAMRSQNQGTLPGNINPGMTTRPSFNRNLVRSSPVYSGNNPRMIRPTPPPTNATSNRKGNRNNQSLSSRPSSYSDSRATAIAGYNTNRGEDRYNSAYSNNGRRPVNRGYQPNNRRVYNNADYRKPVYSAHNPNWRYAYAPRRNSIFNSLPSSYLGVHFGGYGYRYYEGVFYRPFNNVFRVVAPPRGIFINRLPFGYRTLYVRHNPYYYYNGTYYNQRDNNYVVVSPPVGAVVESIPDGYETLTINGETYYEVDGAQYKPVVQDNGEIWYEVIKSNDD